jgi:hypothetical protein
VRGFAASSSREINPTLYDDGISDTRALERKAARLERRLGIAPGEEPVAKSASEQPVAVGTVTRTCGE